MSPDPNNGGETLEAVIEKLVYGGDGLARTPHGVVLVPGVIPGERVTLRLDERRKGVRRGQLLAVVEASADRVSAGCPYFGRCGGCQLQHISYPRQLALRQEILRESFDRVGKIRLDIPISVTAADPWHYRNRTRLRVEKRSDSFRIGYHEAESNKLCAIEACPISSPAINDVIAKLAAGAGAAAFPENVGDAEIELELFVSDDDRTMLATVYSPIAPPPQFGEHLRGALPILESVAWHDHAGRQATMWGSGALTYRFSEFHFRVSHGAFFQTNRYLLDEMIHAVRQDLEGDFALDLYAGVGLFALPLARRFEKVVAVEAGETAARDLAANLGVVGGRARAFHKSVEKFLTVTSANWDCRGRPAAKRPLTSRR